MQRVDGSLLYREEDNSLESLAERAAMVRKWISADVFTSLCMKIDSCGSEISCTLFTSQGRGKKDLIET